MKCDLLVKFLLLNRYEIVVESEDPQQLCFKEHSSQIHVCFVLCCITMEYKHEKYFS